MNTSKCCELCIDNYPQSEEMSKGCGCPCHYPINEPHEDYCPCPKCPPVSELSVNQDKINSKLAVSEQKCESCIAGFSKEDILSNCTCSTPQPEDWEKELRENWHTWDYAKKISFLRQQILIERNKQQEELKEKLGNFAHKQYLGCTLEDGIWHYSYRNEVCNIIEQFFNL